MVSLTSLFVSVIVIISLTTRRIWCDIMFSCYNSLFFWNFSSLFVFRIIINITITTSFILGSCLSNLLYNSWTHWFLFLLWIFNLFNFWLLDFHWLLFNLLNLLNFWFTTTAGRTTRTTWAARTTAWTTARTTTRTATGTVRTTWAAWTTARTARTAATMMMTSLWEFYNSWSSLVNVIIKIRIRRGWRWRWRWGGILYNFNSFNNRFLL